MQNFQFNILTVFLLAFCIGVILKRVFPPQKRSLTSDLWTCQTFGYRYIISIKNGKEIVESLMDFIEKAGIKSGVVSGIGATNNMTLRFFDTTTKKYVDKVFTEQMEIANLIGNISTLDDKPYLHLHITASGADYQAIAGHLLSANISGAGEFIVDAMPSVELKRKYDSDIGINLFDFKE